MGSLAALAYVPLLLTAPGRVGADTKQFLYLDPGRLLRDAAHLWDPGTALGTVTHQSVGYLWPMGPWFWAFEAFGSPDWVAQRLWLGSILLAAGGGVLFLARTMRWPGAGPVVAALVYMLSPYSLGYAARISVILLPWAALPWMVALTMRAVRTGSWRHPALFAAVVTTVGSVNASALLLAGLGPALWVPFAVWVEREVPLRRALAAVGRIGVLTVGLSAWWIAGLAVQGRYGPPVLDYSETLDAVTATAVTVEIARGLGYWFFYGEDKLGPWIRAAVPYTQRLWLIAISFALPLLGVVGALVTRWRHRMYFVALVALGTVVAVGAFPYEDPSPLGAAYKELATSTTAGQALRSTGRATPLVVLGLAVLAGTGLTALARRRPRVGALAMGAVAALAVANLAPLWEGTFVDDNLDRPEELPSYWVEAAAWLDEQSHRTRVLEVPGADFASYRWGNTVDPVTPGLMDRPHAARELVGFGTAPANDLLIALDRRLQERTFEPAALAPIARLMGVGDVVLRADLQYERYRTPRPRLLWQELRDAPGLLDPIGFGEPRENRADPRLPLIDEIALGQPADLRDPPPVAALPVADPVPIVRTRSPRGPLLVAGNGDGLVDAAAAGVLTGDRLVLYSATFAADPARFQDVLARGADLVLTDTNRRQARRWRTVRHNTGYTERAGEVPLVEDLSDARLELFPAAGDDARTVAEHRGGAEVWATGYGNPVSYTAEDRPVLAMDGDPETAWRVGAFSEVVGERLVVELRQPVTVDRITLLQPLTGPRNRWITEARIHLQGASGRDTVDVTLTDSSRTEPGQVVTVPERTVERVEVEVLAHSFGDRVRYDGASGVGFAEVGIGDVEAQEVIRLPRDLLEAAGTASIDHRLTILMSRLRADASEAVKDDDEQRLLRAFSLPVRRSFSVSGTARLSSRVPDEVIDRLIGIPPAEAGGVTARSSARLQGDLRARAASAIDGDPRTHWTPPFVAQPGQWLEVELPAPRRIDRLDLQVVADGRHSVPTRVTVAGDGVEVAQLDLPAVVDQGRPDATVRVPLEVPPFTARTVRLVVDEVRESRVTDWYSLQPITAPVAIAELGIPGVRMPSPRPSLPTECRTDLVTVDGAPLGLRVEGDTDAALDRQGLDVVACGPGEQLTIALTAGDHLVESVAGRHTGIDVDRLVLASARGGAARAPGLVGADPPAAAVVAPPEVEVLGDGPTGMRLRVVDVRPGRPFWLVLGQGWNEGWTAEAEGVGTLGPPTLVDGFANGWLIEPDAAGDLVVTLRWTPQSWVWVGMAISAAAAIGALILVGWERRRANTLFRPQRRVADDTGVSPERRGGGDEPELVSPASFPGSPPAPVRAGVLALLVGAVTALAVDPWLALPAAAAAVVALVFRRGRLLLALGAVGAFVGAASFVVAAQWARDYPPGFEWPQRFEEVHLVGWATVVLLVVDTVVERARRRADREDRSTDSG